MLGIDLRRKILQAQRNELTEHIIYKQLALKVRIKEHKNILERIAAEELHHYELFKKLTQEESRPDKLKAFLYIFISRFLGLNFGLKLMEAGEDLAQGVYNEIKEASIDIDKIIQDERKHEVEIISLLDEERLKYISSMVLGLNDALVELTGALVGFTLALQNTRLVAIVGLITGIAGSMSMAASEYLATKQEQTDKNPFKSSIYTGFAYVGTVILLVFPYFIISNVFVCLGFTLLNVLLIVLVFTFYISVAKGLSFKKRFLEMAILGLSVSALNFLIGLVMRRVFNIEV